MAQAFPLALRQPRRARRPQRRLVEKREGALVEDMGKQPEIGQVARARAAKSRLPPKRMPFTVA